MRSARSGMVVMSRGASWAESVEDMQFLLAASGRPGGRGRSLPAAPSGRVSNQRKATGLPAVSLISAAHMRSICCFTLAGIGT